MEMDIIIQRFILVDGTYEKIRHYIISSKAAKKCGVKIVPTHKAVYDDIISAANRDRMGYIGIKDADVTLL
jgi:hypothetical protein